MQIKEIRLFQHKHKLLQIQAFQSFKVINYHDENNQNSQKPHKFLLAQVSAPKQRN